MLSLHFLYAQLNWSDIDSLIILNRTENIKILVTDSIGNPYQNNEILIQQLNHEFSFGTCISGYFGSFSGNIQQQYEDTLLKYFNSTVDEWSFKWTVIEPIQDSLHFDKADEKYYWSLENNLPMRGHTIFWANEAKVPGWARNLSDEELLIEMKEHVIDIVSRYPEMNEFDVNNEMILNHYFRDRFGESIIDSVFTWSNEVKPNATFYLNEYGIINSVLLDLYIEQINNLISQNISIGGIGIQGHVFTSDEPTDMGVFEGDSVFSADYLWNVIDQLAQFNLPIKITEFDFNAPNDQKHAEWIVNFYKVMFAHPSLEGVIAWGFWEEVHWRPEGAIFDLDFNPKPSADAYFDLIFNQWWTNEPSLTNNIGESEANLFHGLHKLKIQINNEEYIFEFNVENLDDEIQTIIQFELPTLFNITDCSSGDINCDFEINITDILLLVDFILQESIPTLNQIEYSDIDLNGILNIIDILNLIQLILSSP
jgi:endo-1,4-beta-xylanase